jgi:glycosyltransferase involved in cell wall biosynthesis
MKILQLISSRGFYGAENVVIELSLALRKAGCTPVVGVFRNKSGDSLAVAEVARANGLEVEVIPAEGKYGKETNAAIAGAVERHGVDLIHSHGYKTNFAAFWAMGVHRVPLVATCHLYTDENLRLRVYGIVDRFVLRYFDRVFGVSETEARRVIESGVAAERVEVVHNGIDVERFEQGEASLRAPGDGLVVGMVSRLQQHQKNCAGFIRAAHFALGQGIAARFVLVGGGEDRGQFEALAAELGIAEKVTFAGVRKDMPEVYRSLDLFVLPSFAEGLPMVVLECMAAGRAVLATDVGAVSEVVKNGETGVLVASGDQEGLNRAMVELLRDGELRGRLAEGGRRLVRDNFSRERMAGRYLESYERLVSARRRKSRAA